MSTSYNPHSVQIPNGTVLARGPVHYMEPHDVSSFEGGMVMPELRAEVKSAQVNGFYLLEGSMDPEILDMSTDALFNEIPDLALTRLESARGVRFGQLIVRSVSGDERAELASLKAFTTPKDMAHEFAVARYFMGAGKSHGFRTFEPMGMTRLEDGAYGLLSKYEHGVRSLDNVLWNPEYTLQDPVAIRAIGRSAFLLGAMHAAGWTHGDAQVKNMFVSNHEEPFIGDLESANPFMRKNGRPVEAAVNAAITDDIRTLGGSFMRNDERRGIESRLPSDICDLFHLIYLGIVNSPNSAVPLGVRKSASEVKQILTAQY